MCGVGSRRGRWVKATVAVVVAVAGVVAARTTADAGTRLVVANGSRARPAPERVGVVVGDAFDLQTRAGPRVVLQTVTAHHSRNVVLTFGIVHRPPGGAPLGTYVGLSSVGPMHRVANARIAQPAPDLPPISCTTAGPATASQCTPSHVAVPDDGRTWLVIAVRPTRPGRWSVTDFHITYRSWWRARTAISRFELDGTATAR